MAKKKASPAPTTITMTNAEAESARGALILLARGVVPRRTSSRLRQVHATLLPLVKAYQEHRQEIIDAAAKRNSDGEIVTKDDRPVFTDPAAVRESLREIAEAPVEIQARPFFEADFGGDEALDEWQGFTAAMIDLGPLLKD